MYIQKKRIVAEDEIELKEEEFVDEPAEEPAEEPDAEEPRVDAEEIADLLFEAEDVAELLAEVTGQPVEATADEDEVVFAIGEGDAAEEFTITAEGDEEVLESVRRVFRGKRNVQATRKVAPAKSAPVKAPVKASAKAAPARKIPERKIPARKK